MEGQPQDEPQPPPVYMEQPKPALPNLQGIQQLIAGMNTRVLKEPRGFMKILQFVFGISAFATTTSFSTEFSFRIFCPAHDNNNITVSAGIAYPFQVDTIRPVLNICEGNIKTLMMRGDFSSDSRFFVAVGVLAFFYIIAALVLYCLFYTIYENNPLAPLADFAAHVFFAIMWLAGSSAWANSLTALRQATEVSVIMKENPEICLPTYPCDVLSEPNYAKLVISIILGFLNLFLWGSNLWFLYKETQFFKAKTMNTDNAAPNSVPVP
ncbi:synaptophysin-like isoform X2 [Macrobrachium rosenbergii]|uniref:synaptophysin-like isoform X2 n=1 Tax=Macrobrachium rosenbergii TaxID=79674 RepID=UPI0034D5EDB2